MKEDRNLGVTRARRFPRVGWRELLLLAAAVAGTLVLAEVVLRWISPIPRRYAFAPGAFVADPIRGYALTANHRSTMSDGYFREEVVTDAAGFRDPDPPQPWRSVVAIGDSQTFGHGVAVEDTWVEQLEGMVGHEILNMGVPGYGVTQYRPLLESWVAGGAAPPKLVLYAMTWNDVFSGADPPDVNTVRDGLLVPNPRYAGAPAGGGGPIAAYRWLRERLALLRAVDNVSLAIAGGLGIQSDPAFDRELPARTRATQEELLRIKELLDRWGARLVVVHVATGNLVMPDLWEGLRKRVQYPRDFAERAFATWAPAQGIVFADATPALEARYRASGMRRTSILLPVDAHYGPGGHRVIAERFAAVLGQQALLPR